MTYAQQTITDVSEVPAAIAAFAQARGWTKSGNTITRPGVYPGGEPASLSFEIAYQKNANGPRRHRVIVRDPSAPTARWVWTSLPELGGADYNSGAVLTPTKIHLFGNDAPWDEETPGGVPHPWIAAVIECGYNHYRHVFIGNMVRAGAYGGGEIICANHFTQEVFGDNQQSTDFNSSEQKYLFQANCQPSRGNGPGGTNASVAGNPNAGGGVRIIHGDNPVPWRMFRFPNSWAVNIRNSLYADVAFGGIGDGVNDGLLKRGLSEFAGSEILTPYNIFCPQAADGADYRIRPLGWVPGARAIDMRDVQSGASIEVGNKPYRVFAEFQRNPNTTVYRGGFGTAPAGAYWWEAETSGMIGIAYPE